MLTEIKNLFDEINIEEVNQLLEEDITLMVNDQTASRIRSSVLRKANIKKIGC